LEKRIALREEINVIENKYLLESIKVHLRTLIREAKL
jgi:hypothetical protein